MFKEVIANHGLGFQNKNFELLLSPQGQNGVLKFVYPTAFKGFWGTVLTHGVWMGGRAVGKSLFGLYLRNSKV